MNRVDSNRCFAVADMYQVLGFFVVLPTQEVAQGLYGGALVDDIVAIVDELALPGAQEAVAAFRTCLQERAKTEDADMFFHRVRKDYTHLYTNPEFSVSTLLEGRFLGREDEARGLEIALAPTPTELRRLYASKGYESDFKPALREDHMAVQLAFMRALRTNEALALRDGNESVAEEVGATASTFLGEHLGAWGIDFFRVMEAEAEEDVYRFIGALGARFLESEVA